MKIVVGGFQHETNTFATQKADWNAFATGGTWPALTIGDAIFDAVQGANMPIAGFTSAARSQGHEVVASTWCLAYPSAHVTADAYERIAALIIEGVRAALPVDGVYLDLHGAMVAEHVDDGEGELLARLRAVIGFDVPLVASLDFHANITERMVREADGLVGYRTYPHIDMSGTGQRAFELLERILDRPVRPFVAMRKVPFLIPLCLGSTWMDPGRRLYEQLVRLETGGVRSLTFASGFPAADFPECGPRVVAYADSQAGADRAADAMLEAVLEAEPEYAAPMLPPDEAVQRALSIASETAGTVVIADVQDNPGAGGTSDTTGILKALVHHGASNAAIGLIVDPHAASAAHRAGLGAVIRIALGGRSGIPGDTPFQGEFTVDAIADGAVLGTGEFRRGFQMELGPSACLRIGGVRIVVSSKVTQMADLALFRFVGIEPTEASVLVVKSSAHFRADFAPIAKEILICVSPGSMLARPDQLPWRRLDLGIRTAPMARVIQ